MKKLLLGFILTFLFVCNGFAETVDYKDNDIILPPLPESLGLEYQSNKDAANGYPGLDADGNVSGVSDLLSVNDAEYPLGFQTDIGRTYTAIGQVGAADYITQLAYLGEDSLHNKIVLIGTGDTTGHIYKSSDGGLTWIDKGQLGTSVAIDEICYCGNGIVFASANKNPNAGTIYRSVDYGETWSEATINNYLNAGYAGSVYLGNGVCLIGSNGNGRIQRSTDYGANWTYISQPIVGADIIFDMVSVGGNSVISGTGTSAANIIKSTDAGLNWVDKGVLGSNELVYTVAYLGNDICLAGTGYTTGQIYKSIDGGENWTLIGTLGSSTSIYTLKYLGNGVVIAGTEPNAHVFRSDDYGATWEDLGQQGSESAINASLYIGDGITLIGTSAGGKIFRSNAFAPKVDTPGLKHVINLGTGICEGVQDGGDNATILTDADAGLTVNALVGMVIYNLDDSESGIISSNTATTITAAKIGGGSFDWDDGEVWNISGGPSQSDSIIYIGAATTIRHPATAGYIMTYYSIGANAVKIDPMDTMRLWLDGADTGADGDELDSASGAGDFISIHNVSTTVGRTLERSGTWADGGSS